MCQTLKNPNSPSPQFLALNPSIYENLTRQQAVFGGSFNGDDLNMSISETSSSFGAATMDIDMVNLNLRFCGQCYSWIKWPGSPLLLSMTSSINQWRYTPPTMSAVHSNKRKCKYISSICDKSKHLIIIIIVDDRFDPYPATKCSAVSPSLQYLRDSHQAVNSSMSRGKCLKTPYCYTNYDTSICSQLSSIFSYSHEQLSFVWPRNGHHCKSNT
jgi:hypothetical protein